LTSRT